MRFLRKLTRKSKGHKLMDKMVFGYLIFIDFILKMSVYKISYLLTCNISGLTLKLPPYLKFIYIF